MIRPGDIAGTPSGPNAQQAEALESACDRAISASKSSGVWPARVGALRTTISPEVRSAVVAKYCDAGWLARLGDDGRSLIIIDRPVTKLTDARQLDWDAASEAATAIAKLCADSVWTAPEDLELHRERIVRVAAQMDIIARALLLTKPEGK